jgi:hypothetical protein
MGRCQGFFCGAEVTRLLDDALRSRHGTAAGDAS